MSTEFKVPVKLWLDGETYQILLRLARQRNLGEVGLLLMDVSERMATKATQRRKPHVRMTDARLVEMDRLYLKGKALSEIAELLNVSYPTVCRYIRILHPERVL